MLTKNRLIKIIPYIVMFLGLVSALFAFITMQGFENKCNTHWEEEIEVLKEKVTKECPSFNYLAKNKYTAPYALKEIL